MTTELQEAGRQQGWCPQCGMKSVVPNDGRLICSSPQCGWEGRRTEELAAKVFASPSLSPKRLGQLRTMIQPNGGLHVRVAGKIR